VLGKGFPPQIPEATRLAGINRSGTIIFLVITTPADNGGLPDPRALDGIQGLNNLYDNIVIVFSIADTPQTIPSDLVRIEPTADPELETSAYTTERASRQFINRKYPD